MIRKFFSGKFGLLALLVVLLVALSYLEGSSFFKEKEGEDKKIVESEKNRKEIIIEEENSEEVKGEAFDTPTLTPTDSPTPTTISQTSGNIDSFIYPKGSLVEKSSSGLIIESTDNPDVITNWYKAKIDELNMNAVSTVQTNTNGNILNKISASNGSLNVEIEISRSNSAEKTKITVNSAP